MAIDVNYIRRHYASLSDEALAEINRDELVAEARQCYDEECASRNLEQTTAEQAFEDEGDAEHVTAKFEPVEDGETPEWIESAACAAAFDDFSGTDNHNDASSAREALEAAGIPCQIGQETLMGRHGQTEVEYRVMVPGAAHLNAVSILDKKIFNAQMEAEWRMHLEALSNEELADLDPDLLCAGLEDRIARLRRAYKEERARRSK